MNWVLTIYLATLHIPRRRLRKRKSWTIIGRSVFFSFGISTKDEELNLPSLYWIPKLHKCPFKQRYIDRYAKCSLKPLSRLLTCIIWASELL